jgi:glycosyltransferase involved in cell wall biosynthesis
MIFVNQSIGNLSNDILENFIENNESILVFTGRNIETKIKSDKIKYFYGAEYNRRNNFTRLASWFFFTGQCFIFLLKNRNKEKEIFLVSNPPLLYFLIIFFRKYTFYLLVYDLYPDILKIKFKKDYLGVIKIWSVLNKIVFKKASLIFTIGDNMKKSISNYVSIDRILVVNNWAQLLTNFNFNEIEKLDKIHNYLSNKFIFIYSGNMGATHNFDVVKSLMLDLNDNPEIIFLFVGGGSKFNEMNIFVTNNGLKNAFFMQKLPSDEFDYILYKSSLGIVTLEKAVENFSVPSKTFSYLSHGLPILNFSSKFSEITEIVNRHNIGINFDVNDYQTCLEGLKNFIANKHNLSVISETAYQVSEKYFSPKNAENYLVSIKKYRNAFEF